MVLNNYRTSKVFIKACVKAHLDLAQYMMQHLKLHLPAVLCLPAHQTKKASQTIHELKRDNSIFKTRHVHRRQGLKKIVAPHLCPLHDGWSHGSWDKENLFDANMVSVYGWLLLNACHNANLDLAKQILHHHKPRADFISKSFLKACQCGQLGMVSFFVQEHFKEIDFDAFADAGLLLACLNNHLEVVRYLLTSEEIVHAKQISGRSSAAGKRAHADIHTQEDMAVFFAVHNMNLAMLRFLLCDPLILHHHDSHSNIHRKKDSLLEFMSKDENRPSFMPIWSFLIFEYYIAVTAPIARIIQIHGDIRAMFDKRTLEKSLPMVSSSKVKKNKL